MIVVYNKDLTIYHDIASAISIQMVEYYNDIGKATLVLPIDDYNIGIVENGGIVYDTERDVSFVIVNHKYDTTQNTLTVNCYTSNSLLNKRAIVGTHTVSNIESDVLKIVSENLRGLPSVELQGATGFTDETSISVENGQVLDQIMPILDIAEIGNRMVWNPDSRTHIFQLYKGRNLTSGIHAVTFSDIQGTARNLVISDDESIFKNVIYIPGELSDGTQIVVEVGTAESGNRFERWHGGSNKQENEETEEQFRERLKSIGVEEVSRLVNRMTFSVDIDPEEYGKAYRLGDIVSCVSERFGIALTSRISGVKYVLDANSEQIELILGKPVLTALKEVMYNGRY